MGKLSGQIAETLNLRKQNKAPVSAPKPVKKVAEAKSSVPAKTAAKKQTVVEFRRGETLVYKPEGKKAVGKVVFEGQTSGSLVSVIANGKAIMVPARSLHRESDGKGLINEAFMGAIPSTFIARSEETKFKAFDLTADDIGLFEQSDEDDDATPETNDTPEEGEGGGDSYVPDSPSNTIATSYNPDKAPAKIEPLSDEPGFGEDDINHMDFMSVPADAPDMPEIEFDDSGNTRAADIGDPSRGNDGEPDQIESDDEEETKKEGRRMRGRRIVENFGDDEMSADVGGGMDDMSGGAGFGGGDDMSAGMSDMGDAGGITLTADALRIVMANCAEKGCDEDLISKIVDAMSGMGRTIDVGDLEAVAEEVRNSTTDAPGGDMGGDMGADDGMGGGSVPVPAGDGEPAGPDEGSMHAGKDRLMASESRQAAQRRAIKEGRMPKRQNDGLYYDFADIGLAIRESEESFEDTLARIRRNSGQGYTPRAPRR